MNNISIRHVSQFNIRYRGTIIEMLKRDGTPKTLGYVLSNNDRHKYF